MDSDRLFPSGFGGKARATGWIALVSGIVLLVQVWQRAAEQELRGRLAVPAAAPATLQDTVFSRTFALDPRSAFGVAGAEAGGWKPWQFATSLFLQAGIPAFLLAVAALLLIAPEMERLLGTGKFLGLFLVCGGGSAVVEGLLGLSFPAPSGAASRGFGFLGAVSGALTAFGILFPEGLWLPGPFLPVRRAFVLGLAWVAAYLALFFAQGRDPVVFATLAGMPLAWVYVRADGWLGQLLLRVSLRMQEREFEQDQEMRRRLDDLLVKLRRSGYDSLTRKEKSFLRFASRRARGSRARER